LVAVAQQGDAEVAAIDACGATGVVLSLLGDQSQEASKDTLEPTLTLLATLARLRHVPAAAMDANVLPLLRSVLARFCSDPSRPNPSVLALVANITGEVRACWRTWGGGGSTLIEFLGAGAWRCSCVCSP
jgi:hypothetical protein